jgi:site-specific DNA-cytosine methylase
MPSKLRDAFLEIAGLSKQQTSSMSNNTLTEVSVFHDHGFSLFKEEPETDGTLVARDYKGTRHYVIEKHAVTDDGLSDYIFTFYSTQGKQDQFTEDIATTLKAGSVTCIATMTVVRRFTEIESERLMGWTDDHTRFRADGKETPSSQRYKMCGNGVVAPVATWIGLKIMDTLKK